MNKKKSNSILVISPVGIGPPYHGNRTRIKSILLFLKGKGYHISFLGINLHEDEIQTTSIIVDNWVGNLKTPKDPIYDRVIRKVIRILNYILKKQKTNNVILPKHCISHTIDYWVHPNWHPIVNKIGKENKFEIILIEYVVYSAFFKYFNNSPIKIIDTHDVLTNRNETLAQSGILSNFYSLYKRDEAIGLERADIIIAIQDNEALYYKSIINKHKINVFTIGHLIDENHLPDTTSGNIGIISSDNPINIKSVQAFIDDVFAIIKKEAPETELIIAGNICNKLKVSDNIRLLGRVERLEDFYNMITLAVNPTLIGTGLKIKTVEAMSYGRLVISYESGVDGLEKYIGNGIALVNNPEEMVQEILLNLKDNDNMENGGKLALKSISKMNMDTTYNLNTVFTC